MPQPSSAITAEPFHNALILGGPKVGKSTCIISSAAKLGGVYVISTEEPNSLAPAARRCKFDWDHVTSWQKMMDAVKTAREGIKAGRYKSVVVDTLSKFAERLETELSGQLATEAFPDGNPYKVYPLYAKRLVHLCDNFITAKCHFWCITHYMETGAEIDGGTPKTGKGVVPCLAGQARAKVPAAFSNVVFMQRVGENRVFHTAPTGVWDDGFACRSLEGKMTMPADVGALIDAFENPKNQRVTQQEDRKNNHGTQQQHRRDARR